VDRAGRLVGRVTARGAEKSRDPHVRSAAQRAIQAVYNAAPFRSLPPEFFGERIAVTFDAAEACS
jgi:protein TonB